MGWPQAIMSPRKLIGTSIVVPNLKEVVHKFARRIGIFLELAVAFDIFAQRLLTQARSAQKRNGL